MTYNYLLMWLIAHILLMMVIGIDPNLITISMTLYFGILKLLVHKANN